MVQRPFGLSEILRFTIKPVGPLRSEREIRREVADALAEAVKSYKSETKNKNVRAEAEPEGPFTGIELAALWLLKTFAGGVVGAAGAATGKKIYSRFAVALKKRNLDPGPPSVVKQNSGRKRGGPEAKGRVRKKRP